MKSKFLGLVMVLAVALGLSIFAVPSVGLAGTINTLRVDVGVNSWCSGVVANCNPALTPHVVAAWTLPFAIPLSNTLALTQTGGPVSSFDFDTSEGVTGGCLTCLTAIFINGLAVLPDVPALAGPTSANVLAQNGDDGTSTHNEATNYVVWRAIFPLDATHNIEVDVGYADNVHTNVCADNPTPLPNAAACFPGLTTAFDATTVLGGGTTAAGFVETNANHCDPATNSCFDAGVIRIREIPTVVTPEPASLLLLGAGLTGLAAWAGRRRQKKD